MRGRSRPAAALMTAAFLVASCSSGAHRATPPTVVPTTATTAIPSTVPGPSTTIPQATSVPAPPGPLGDPVGQPIKWTACNGTNGPKGYQCAAVMMPRDPEHPGSDQIAMAVDRRPATPSPAGEARIGSLLINPGGPGVSGVDYLSSAVKMLPANVLSRFDVVGFDPPGVARTAPIKCLDDSGMESYFNTDPAPATEAAINGVLGEARTFAAGCQKMSGAELPYVSTVDAAIDMDRLRADVGDSKLTYLGFSYGTFLGAQYADLYPERVRALVLDGAVDSSLPPIVSLQQQSAAIDEDLQEFFASCKASQVCPWQPGTDLKNAYDTLVTRVRVSPLKAKGTSRRVGPSQLLYGTAFAMYSTTFWPFLEAALQKADAGDGTPLLRLFDDYTDRQPDGSYTNEFAANAAINCLDAAAPSIQAIEAAAPTASAAAPVFGISNLYSEFGCAVWPVPATSAPRPLHANGAPPIVVVGSTKDPATPYMWAQSLAAQLQSGILLTRLGAGHTAYGASACIRTYVNAYLIDLTPPKKGLQCPSN